MSDCSVSTDGCDCCDGDTSTEDVTCDVEFDIPDTISVNKVDLTSASNLCVSADFTSVTGDGVIDDLMEAVNIHLSAQYELERLTGSEYSSAYVGLMNQAIQAGTSFLLQKDKSEYEAKLVAAQIQAEEYKACLVLAQVKLANAQADSAQAERCLICEKILTEQKQRELIQTEIDTKLAQSEADTEVKAATAEKTYAETGLLEEKTVTESAQASVPPKPGTILSAQYHLFGQQANAFKWNADQKYMETLVNGWSMNVNAKGDSDWTAKYMTTEGNYTGKNGDTANGGYLDNVIMEANPGYINHDANTATSGVTRPDYDGGLDGTSHQGVNEK